MLTGVLQSSRGNGSGWGSRSEGRRRSRRRPRQRDHRANRHSLPLRPSRRCVLNDNFENNVADGVTAIGCIRLMGAACRHRWRHTFRDHAPIKVSAFTAGRAARTRLARRVIKRTQRRPLELVTRNELARSWLRQDSPVVVYHLAAADRRDRKPGDFLARIRRVSGFG